MTKGNYRAGKNGRETIYTSPRILVAQLNAEFGFTFDVCAITENAQCTKFFSPEINGLTQSWQGEVCWMNPPFSDVEAWLKKAYDETRLGSCLVVAIIPGRTSSPWFHDYVMKAAEVRFLRSKTYFTETLTQKKYTPFLGMVVAIFKSGTHTPIFKSMKQPGKTT